MILFWMIAAGMVVLALLFIIPPFLRQQRSASIGPDELNLKLIKQQLSELEPDLASGNLGQTQYEAAKKDLEKELLLEIPANEAPSKQTQERSGRWAAGIAGIGVPVLTIALYQIIGNQDIIEQLANNPARPSSSQNLPSMEVLVERLANRLQQEPNNVEGWLMLARSYVALGRTSDALDSYKKAYQLAPENPAVLLNYAELFANLDNNQLSGRPAELIAKALELAPTNPNALWMMGLVHYEQGNYSQAVVRWEQLVGLLPPGSEDVAAVTKYIDKAHTHLSPETVLQPGVGATESSEQDQMGSQVHSGGRIDVEISLAPELNDKAAATDTVFIFARALKGPRMPLAAVRKQAKDLPTRITLTDSMAMTPQFVLSSFPQVIVGARISTTGNAIAQSGDLQGEVHPVKPGQEAVVKVVIDEVRP